MKLYTVSVRSEEYLGSVKYYYIALWADSIEWAKQAAQIRAASLYYGEPCGLDEAQHFTVQYVIPSRY
jgi:hypothetical protein